MHIWVELFYLGNHLELACKIFYHQINEERFNHFSVNVERCIWIKKKCIDSSSFRMQDGSVRRFWVHFLPWIQQIYNYIWNNSLWRESGNRMNRASTTRDRTNKGKRGRDIVLPRKKHSRHNILWKRGISKVQKFSLNS